MEQKVDLHIHTCYSDGSSTPTEIVKRAKELGYDQIAITDHDGVDGVQEAIIAGEALGLEVIAGVELSTETDDGMGLHILGYHIDIQNPRLQEVLEDLRKKRARRNEKLLDILTERGYPVEMPTDAEYVGKPNIAREMVKKGYINNPKEAFTDSRFFASEEIRTLKKEKLKTHEAIALIEEVGGIAVLAHPIQIRRLGEPGSEEFYEKLEDLIKDLKVAGLKGLECYYPEHTAEQAMRFVEIAEKHHLHITRGSDSHGEDFQ